MSEHVQDDTQSLSDYRSYLLRLWRVDGSDPVWRASLESVESRERIGFASISDLFRFLENGVFRASRLRGSSDPDWKGGEFSGQQERGGGE
ncbi:MAG: hypothetical protein PVH41_17795 [Anaerolineae bacterium]|jgi:hypothetical protein